MEQASLSHSMGLHGEKAVKRGKGWEIQLQKSHVRLQGILRHAVGLIICSCRDLLTGLSSIAVSPHKTENIPFSFMLRGRFSLDGGKAVSQGSLSAIIDFLSEEFLISVWGTSGVVETPFKFVSVVIAGTLFSNCVLREINKWNEYKFLRTTCSTERGGCLLFPVWFFCYDAWGR